MGHRPERVRSLLMEAVSSIIPSIKDPLVNNGLGSELISITDIKVTNDLSFARLFVSIMAPAERQQEILEGLRRATGYIRHELRSEVSLMKIPNLAFELDDTLDRADRISELLKQASVKTQPVAELAVENKLETEQ